MDKIDTMVNRRLDETFKAYPDTEEMHELREELAADLSEVAHDNEKKAPPSRTPSTGLLKD